MAAPEAPSPDLSYLPDSSTELAAAADLSVTAEGTQLPLHSQVLAAGSRVLRTALLDVATGGGGGSTAADRAAAVQRAFEGCSLADVRGFLRLLYSPHAVFSMAADLMAFQGIAQLADKLDAAGVMEVSGACLYRCRWPAAHLRDRRVQRCRLEPVSVHLNLILAIPRAGVRPAPQHNGHRGLAGLAPAGRHLWLAAPAAHGSSGRVDTAAQLVPRCAGSRAAHQGCPGRGLRREPPCCWMLWCRRRCRQMPACKPPTAAFAQLFLSTCPPGASPATECDACRRIRFLLARFRQHPANLCNPPPHTGRAILQCVLGPVRAGRR